MLNFDNYEILRDKKVTLKETSKDDSKQKEDVVEFMTESALQVINFDGVKTEYTNKLGLSEETATSVDALTQTCDHIVFIEFKNGKVHNSEVKSKIKDSLLILCDILGKNIDYTRKNLDFVLVYNESKNTVPNQYKKRIPQESTSRSYITKTFLQKGGQEIVLFDLERYKNLYFRTVHTFPKEEFECYISQLRGC